MRVLVIDPDPARAALVAEGLAGVSPLEVLQAAAYDERQATAFAPDVVVIACDSPDRDTLESLREASEGNPRPVVMFVDRSEPGLADEAVRAGVAAYVVDGLSAGRGRAGLGGGVRRVPPVDQARQGPGKAQAGPAPPHTGGAAKALPVEGRG